MPPKDKMHFAGSVPAEDVAGYLEAIARGIRERSMILESGDSSISVDVSDEMKFDLEISSDADKGKSSIELSIGWRARRDDEAALPAGLTIVPGAHAEVTSFAE